MKKCGLGKSLRSRIHWTRGGLGYSNCLLATEDCLSRVEMSGYVPPHIRRGAAEMGMNIPAYKEYLAAKAAAEEEANRPRREREEADRLAALEAAKPRPLGQVWKHDPSAMGAAAAAVPSAMARRRSSSSQRRRSARRVTQKNRRTRVNLNTGQGMNELHPEHTAVSPGRNARTANYRLSRRSPAVANMNAFKQKKRQHSLVMALEDRAIVPKVTPILVSINANLERLVAKNILSSEDSREIAAIGATLKELIYDE